MTKRTLAARSAGAATSALVRLDQRHVEDLAEGVGDLLAGALDVRGDHRRPATTSSWKRA